MAEKSTAKSGAVVYTEEQISSVLARVEELGNLRNASDEAGIPWQKVAQWKKKIGAGVSAADLAEAEKAKLEKQAAKADKSAKKAAPKAAKSADRKTTSGNAEKKAGRKTGKKNADAKASEKTAASSVNQEEQDLNPIIVENAVLKEEVRSLKEQVGKLKKALGDLM